MKKMGNQSSGRIGTVVISLLLAVTLVINIVCIQMFPAINAFMAANLNSRLPGQGSAISATQLTPEETKENSRHMARELVREGIVLLENKNAALPLESGTKVNLFGFATVSPLYGGMGSGASDTSSNVNLIQGLQNADFIVNEDLTDFYQSSGVKRPSQGGFVGSDFTPAEVPAERYSDALLQGARTFSDVAVVMLSRIGGEGGDLPMDMYASGFSETDDGRSYLELTRDEEALLALVKSQNYAKVIVLINSSHAMELAFLEDEGIDAALWIGGPGSTGMDAVGEVLSGAVTPSGRLTDTYAYDLTTAPAYWNAGSFTYDNLARNYVEYAEGIYVGYRFYETRFVDNTTGICDETAYRNMVQYPFGHGLSYTTFTQTIDDYSTDGDMITLKVSVENTGTAAGKDVVQVYYTAPYVVGGIEKSHVVLGNFAKTELLQPGERGTVTVAFPIEDMASYDEKTSGCYVLEAGNYEIKLMNNAHDVIDTRTYSVESTVVYGVDAPRGSDAVAAVNRFDDVSSGQIERYVSRADWEGTLPTARVDGKPASAETAAALTAKAVYESDPADPAITFADHGLMLADMAGLDYDDPKWSDLLEQLSVEDMTNLISNGGWSTPELSSVGKPATNDLDGPAGLNSLVSSLKGVSFPSEAVMGATWNQALLEEFGAAFGDEAVANHVVGLYAPGVNLHRTPFSGRNFEYYSEDGLHSGKLAAAMIRGAQTRGVYCYVKHFALNDQESNRLSLSVWANEQSMRELYFKPFELAVKEGGTTAIMSSYSYFGDIWAGASKALLTEVLRNEWGFRGMVITDSAMANTGWMDVNLAIRAGGDMMLCLMGVTLDSSTNTAQQAMRVACHNILYTQANSVAVSAAADTAPYWLFLLVVLDTIVLSAAALFFLGRGTWGKTWKLGAKIALVAAIALVLALVFWACFFRAGGVPSSGAPTTSAAVPPTKQPGGDAPPQTSDSGDSLYAELYGKGDEWLGCHVKLAKDGSFTISFDYNAENSGIQTDTGTWVENTDGTLTLTGGNGKEYTAAVKDNGDGTMTYTMDVVNSETSITCSVSGTAAVAEPADDGLYTELYGKGDEWLGCHVKLMKDGSFTVSFDYNAENSGIQTDTGTWVENADGTLTLTGGNGKEYTAAVKDNGDGTMTYTGTITNAETSIECNVSGTAPQR